MAVSQKRLESTKKYLSKFDDIKIRVPQGDRKKWRNEAEKRGKSLNQFVIDTVETEIKKEN